MFVVLLVAGEAGGRGPLERAIDVTRTAGGQEMSTGEREDRLVVVDRRTLP